MKQRRRPTRDELLARLPRAFRPGLDAGQRLDLALCHHENLDAIVTGVSPSPNCWW